MNTKLVPCPDPNCINGTIMVCNAYNDDPFIGEPQPCDICKGKGSLVAPVKVALN